MTTKITKTKIGNVKTAENDLFIYVYTNPDYLTYKPTGKLIHQMDWYEWKNSEPIEDQNLRNQITAFRAEIKAINEQNQKKSVSSIDNYIDTEPKHGINGYCRKCHSYCYGDCEAN